jgi:DNA-binding NarL/FixJ family response regulator
MTEQGGTAAAAAVRSGHLVLLLVDDSRVFAEVLASRLRADASIKEVWTAFSLAEARASLQHSRPDLVLLDLQLGEDSGLELLQDLTLMPGAPRVMMLSGADSTQQVVQALDAKADGWVSKTARFETLMDAVHRVARGDMYLAPPSLGPVLRHLLSRDRVDQSFVDALSARQLEVLRCVVAGMSRLECAGRLHVSVNTVRTHVQALMKRADVHSTLALAAVARDVGVRGIDEEPDRRMASRVHSPR